MSLRPYQKAAVAKLLARPDKRLILDHCPGAGKTLCAIAILQELKALRTLVICPARARSTWVREFGLWAPELEIHPIIYGRTRSLPKAASAARDLAYSVTALNKVTSFALLDQLIDQVQPNAIIVDECHHLSDPQSEQSRLVKKLFKRLPKVPAVFLTGTLVRKEVGDIWNQVDTLWPNLLGKPTLAGDVAFKFRQTYCEAFESEYAPSGFVYKGAKAEALPALRAKLAPYVHTVTEAEILEYLPKFDAQPLYIDDGAALKAVVTSWAETAVRDFTHVGVVVYHREVAAEICTALRRKFKGANVVLVTGDLPVLKRDALIEETRAAPTCILVATSEAVGESIDLTHIRTALIAEWRQTPGQATQLMRRFWRAKEGALPVYLRYVIYPDDESHATVLMERMAAVKSLTGGSATGAALDGVMKKRELTAERLDALFDDMFSEVRTVETDDE